MPGDCESLDLLLPYIHDTLHVLTTAIADSVMQRCQYCVVLLTIKISLAVQYRGCGPCSWMHALITATQRV
jgi:hypothetical protein